MEKFDTKYLRYVTREQITQPEIYELVLDILMNLIERYFYLFNIFIQKIFLFINMFYLFRIMNMKMEGKGSHENVIERCHIVNSCIQTVTEVFFRNKHSVVETNFMTKLLSHTGKQLLTSTITNLKG